MSAPPEDDRRRSVGYKKDRMDEPNRMPDRVKRAARAAFDAPRPDHVAVLVYDSLVDAEESPQKHVLRFEHDRLDLHLHLSVEREATSIEGVVERGGASRAGLHFQDVAADEAVYVPVDGVSFDVSVERHGLVRISLESELEPPIWTDWFSI